jgi:aryl-alcohol dehydrogenase (NADP+)
MDPVRLGATRLHVSRLLHKPGVTAPIVGTTKMEHLEDAIAAADVSLSDEEIALLEEPAVPHPVLGHG